jgi:hypothetical protein
MNLPDGPVPVEPSAVWRMLVNDWPYREVEKLLRMSPGQVLKAEQLQNADLHGVDPELIADPTIDRRKSK